VGVVQTSKKGLFSQYHIIPGGMDNEKDYFICITEYAFGFSIDNVRRFVGGHGED
jgi:hypothetical protein